MKTYPVILKKKVYDKQNKLVGCNISVFVYKDSKYECEIHNYCKRPLELIKSIINGELYPINFIVKSNNVITVIKYSDAKIGVEKIANSMRNFMEKNYGVETDLAGHCIEASEYLAKILGCFNIRNTKVVEGYCLWENEDYGSDRPYDEHTWLEIDSRYYLDITADQFNVGFFDYGHFKPVEFRARRPDEMHISRPIEGEDYWTEENLENSYSMIDKMWD